MFFYSTDKTLVTTTSIRQSLWNTGMKLRKGVVNSFYKELDEHATQMSGGSLNYADARYQLTGLNQPYCHDRLVCNMAWGIQMRSPYKSAEDYYGADPMLWDVAEELVKDF